MISFGFVVCSRSVSAACAGWPSPSVASRLRPTACLCGPPWAASFCRRGNCWRQLRLTGITGRRDICFCLRAGMACASLGSFPVGIVWPAFPVVSGSLCLPWQLSCRHRVAGVPAVSGSLCLPWQLPVGIVWPAFPVVSGSLCLPWQLPVGVVWPAFPVYAH